LRRPVLAFHLFKKSHGAVRKYFFRAWWVNEPDESESVRTALLREVRPRTNTAQTRSTNSVCCGRPRRHSTCMLKKLTQQSGQAGHH